MAWLVAAQFAGAQTAEQDYKIINSMTAHSDTLMLSDGTTQPCQPASSVVRHRCNSSSAWYETAIGSSYTYNCTSESVVIKAESIDAQTVAWQCGEDNVQYIDVVGTISACGFGNMTYTVRCY